MPLSEQEQRLLDEMERNLLLNDADVVSAASATRAFSYRNLVYGALMVILGLVGLIVGIVLFQQIADAGSMIGIGVGVVGFLLIGGGVIVAMRRPEASGDEPVRAASTASSKRENAAGFMDRMNDRWDRRQDSDD